MPKTKSSLCSFVISLLILSLRDIDSATELTSSYNVKHNLQTVQPRSGMLLCLVMILFARSF